MVNESIKLDNLIDTHVHTSPDIKPRLYSVIEAALDAKKEKMGGLVIKSHLESTALRAINAQKKVQIPVWGGVCLNSSVGGIHAQVVKNSALQGAKVVWLPTISAREIEISPSTLEEIFPVLREYDMVLATGHLLVEDIFMVLDMAQSWGLKRILINHPLTKVVGANLDEQKEMSRYGFLEHCFVACSPKHDGLSPSVMAEAIQEIGAQKCIMATDYGQKHNQRPVDGLKEFISSMMEEGICQKEINRMCSINPRKLLL